MPNPSRVRRHKGLVRHTLHQLLLVDAVRYAVAGVRFLYYATLLGRLKTADESEHVSKFTVSHNLRGLRDLAVTRSMYLIRPLSTVERLEPACDMLVVGPRTEGELLALLGHGFDRRHVTAIDLITYSPWVDAGDLHNLPYADSSFDAVMLGWVLAYTDTPARAADEVVRVARPGAVVAIGVEWNPLSDSDLEAQHGYVPGASKRFQSTEEILALFGERVDEVILREDVPEFRQQEIGSIIVLFTVRKAPVRR